MSVMAAAVVALSDDGSGSGEITPRTFRLIGGYLIGGFPAREYRLNSSLFVVQRIRSGGSPKKWLVIIWVKSSSRSSILSDFLELFSDYGMSNILGRWKVILDSDGFTLRIPDLESDVTSIGTLVKAAWPSTWKSYLPTDIQPVFEGPPGVPTGPMFIYGPLS